MDRQERVAINRDLANARRMVATIRGLYAVFAAFGAIPTFLLFRATAVEDGVWPMFFVSLVLTLALAAGALFAHLHPLGWTLALACLWSIQSALGLLAGGLPILSLLLAIGLWAVVPLMLKVHRLMREHPDLVDTSKLKRRDRREDVEVSEARVRALARARKSSRAGLRTFATIGGIIVALVAGVWLTIALSSGTGNAAIDGPVTRISDEEAQRIADRLPPRIREFQTHWARSDLAAIEVMFVGEKQVTYWPKVLELLERRGWQDDLPDIGAPDFSGSQTDKRNVFFPIHPKGTLKTRWKYEGSVWSIDTLVFSRTR